MIRVLVADDDPLIRAGIRQVLASAADIDVVAEVADGHEAVEAARRWRPEVALLDIQMPRLDGLAAAEELARVAPAVRSLILTTFGEDRYIADALRLRLAGFILKDSAPDELIQAVRSVAAGAAYLSPPVAQRVIQRFTTASTTTRREAARDRVAALTPRERTLLRLLAEGRSNAAIATEMSMTETTIKSYVSRLLTKLDCANRVQAAIVAIDAGLIGDS
jgi:DNA-binding NarL/FixJ family response regulator